MKRDLVAIIQEQERLARTWGDLDDDRRDALDRYFGRPYGDEIEGRSGVVMRDVADTVEWIKPSLMRIFCSGDDVVSFDPVGPEDVAQAEQETDYVNHVVMGRNSGFVIFHDWFHDALLQKTGYVLVENVKEQRSSLETYKGLSQDEVALLAQDGVEVLESAEYLDAYGQPVYDLRVRKTEEYPCTKLSNIPPERVLIASDWPHVNLEGCQFVEVIDYMTISDLRQRGYDVEDTISDSNDAEEDEYVDEGRKRWDLYRDRDDIEADPATRRVRVRKVWIQIDEDEDGVAELRHIVLVGTTILEDEETDVIPIAAITALRQPHEHYGQSIADLVKDLQRIRTVLVRGFLDNMYLANNGRHAIDINRVNLDDMLVSRPGGVVRVNGGLGDAIQPLVQPQNGAATLQAIEYMDTVRENRSGVTKYNQGLDANSLNKTASGINQIMSASQQRIEMIARIFAETGVKTLMLLVHALSIKNGRQQEVVKLRNQWVPVNPREWKTRRNVTISVGLGTGNKDQQAAHLMTLLQMQQQALAIGIATPQNIYNAAKKYTQSIGFKVDSDFWTDPSQQPPQPPPPNPEMVKAQAEMQKEQMRQQMDVQKFQAEQQAEQQRLAFEAQQKELDRQVELEKAKIQSATQIEIAKLKEEMAARVEMEREKMRAEPVQVSAQMDPSNIEGAIQSVGVANQEILMGLMQTMQALQAAIERPKQVLRGPDGKIMGVQ